MKNATIRSLAAAVALLLMLSCLFACGAAKDSATPSEDYKDNVSAGGVENKPVEGVGPDVGNGTYDRKIIRTVTMSCESKAFDDAVQVIMTALSIHGGYVEKSSSSGTARSVAPEIHTQSARYASYTLRVPAEKLDAFLSNLSLDEGIRVLRQEMSSDEITGAYYDAKTRMETLAAEKDSLTVMLSGFTDYSDISAMLQVQERLYNVIEEMEVLQTKLNLYDGQVAMSTVYLDLREVLEYTAVEEPTFGDRVGKAFTESWTDFWEGCQDFAVWFVEAFPTLLVIAVIAVVVIILIKRRIRKKRE